MCVAPILRGTRREGSNARRTCSSHVPDRRRFSLRLAQFHAHVVWLIAPEQWPSEQRRGLFFFFFKGSNSPPWAFYAIMPDRGARSVTGTSTRRGGCATARGPGTRIAAAPYKAVSGAGCAALAALPAAGGRPASVTLPVIWHHASKLSAHLPLNLAAA